MKTILSEHDIIGFDALYDSMRKCRKGVMWKASVASFSLNGIERVMKLEEELKRGTYKARPPVQFRITSPKPREISSVCFKDRVYQRSLNDNAIYPVMSNSFIHDNYACQIGKGTDAARDRLKEFLRRYYRKHGSRGWVAQFDIHGYYPNMDHATVESVFREKLDGGIYKRAQTILREQYPGEKGYNPGSQLVQIAGISVLDGLDHFIKEELHAEIYERYMDDFYIASDDYDFLVLCQQRITEYLSKLHFELNPKKTRIYPLSEGILFLGFRFKLEEHGKVYLLIDPDNVKRKRHQLARLIQLAKDGYVTRKQVRDSYESWKNHAQKGNSVRLLRRMDQYYKLLWEA